MKTKTNSSSTELSFLDAVACAAALGVAILLWGALALATIFVVDQIWQAL